MITRIAVIDDDEDLRNLLKISLGIHGYEVASYANGQAFLDSFDKNLPADLYIIDLNLGGMSGHELCEHLRLIDSTKNSVIILISANPEVREHAVEAGADGHLFKPFSQKELIAKIQALSEKSR